MCDFVINVFTGLWTCVLFSCVFGLCDLVLRIWVCGYVI